MRAIIRGVGSAATRMTELEYLEYDRLHEGKHEYVNGAVVAMAGSDPAHDRVVVNLITTLSNQLRSTGCRVHSADLRVRLNETGLYAYPDVSVVCGKAEFAETTPRTLLNPTFLVEVLSPSTAAWDADAKAAHYRRRASLQAHALISLADRRCELFERQADGRWLLTTASGSDVLRIEPLGIDLPLAEVFDGVAELETEGEGEPRPA